MLKSLKKERFFNSKLNDHAVSDYLKEHLEIKEYIPFKDKRMIAEMVVSSNIELIDGVKKYDSINSYIGFVVTMLTSHTNLEFSSDPVADYDVLAESGLLTPIIETFRSNYTECDILLKMALAYEMEDNNVGAVVGRFLHGVLGTIDGIGEAYLKSWRGAKHDIEQLDDRYSVLFDNLNPVRFKYNDGTSGRYHTGFILDELKSAMDAANITTQELAAYCVSDQETGEGGIRYGALIALLVKEVQTLKKEIKEIKGNG